MKRTFPELRFASSFLLAAACFALTGCVDDSYEVSEDMDMTIGLGSEGLKLKLGSTEKIMLADLLEVDENLKTDAQNIYYLVEDGSTHVNFHVNEAKFDIDNTKLSPSYPIINYAGILEKYGLPAGSQVNIPQGETFIVNNVEAKSDMGFEVNSIDAAVKQIKNITLEPGSDLMRFHVYLEQNGTRFRIKEFKNLEITFPNYINLASMTNGTLAGQTCKFSDRTNINLTEFDLGSATIKDLELADNRGVVNNEELVVRDEKITMKGSFVLDAASAFAISNNNQEVTLHLDVYIGQRGPRQTRVTADKITGRFDPEINPAIENIDIAENLPDFLEDENVTIKVANPTLKFMLEMNQIPASLNVSGTLSSVKDNKTIATVNLPENGVADAYKFKDNTIYFHQDALGPYDPDGVVADAQKHVVSRISTLIEKLPDYINVNVSDRKISLKDEDVTLEFGHDYGTNMRYNLYVPFTFENGLKIVYNDSIEDMNEDLQDYSAEGLELTADIVNAVPLQLLASAVAIDINGKPIEGIRISTAEVAPAQALENDFSDEAINASTVTTAITLNMDLDKPELLKLLDRLDIRIEAEGVQENEIDGVLSSKQYIKVNNIRLKLKGQIVGDFN